jgi:2-methylisocitrate lyase-like PEP mutase family enzyme
VECAVDWPELPRPDVTAHLAGISELVSETGEPSATLHRATDLPVSVDLENGYGADPESAALAFTRVAEAGAVGASIEGWDPSVDIYDLHHAAKRVAAAAQAMRPRQRQPARRQQPGSRVAMLDPTPTSKETK